MRPNCLAVRARLAPAALLVLLLTLRSAVAEDANPLFLLSHPVVQADLVLSAEQRADVAELGRSLVLSTQDQLNYNNEVLALAGEWATELMPLAKARLHEIDVEHAARAEVALTAEQLIRLRQIEFQRRGPKVFLDPEVRRRLEVSPGQSETLAGLAGDANTLSVLAIQLRGQQILTQRGLEEYLAGLRALTKAQSVALLNAEQQALFVQWHGSAIDLGAAPLRIKVFVPHKK